MNVAEIDTQLASIETEIASYKEQIETARRTLATSPNDASAVAQLTNAKAMLESLPYRQAGLELDRAKAERETAIAHCDQLSQALQRAQKQVKKRWATEAQNRNAWIAAFTEWVTADREASDLTEQYNRAAVTIGRELEPLSDPTVDALQGVIAGLLHTVLALSQETDKRTLPALGIVGKAKLAVDALLADGTVLNGEQIAMLERLYTSSVNAAKSSYDVVQFDHVIGQALEYIKAAKAVRPQPSGGPLGIQIDLLQRNGIPQSAINAVHAQVQKFERELRNEPEPVEPEPAPPGKPIVAYCPRCHAPFTSIPRRGNVCLRCGWQAY